MHKGTWLPEAIDLVQPRLPRLKRRQTPGHDQPPRPEYEIDPRRDNPTSDAQRHLAARSYRSERVTLEQISSVGNATQIDPIVARQSGRNCAGGTKRNQLRGAPDRETKHGQLRASHSGSPAQGEMRVFPYQSCKRFG